MAGENDVKYWVGLSHWPGLGRKKLELLMRHFGSVQKIWQAGPDLNRRWSNNLDLDEEMKQLERYQTRAIIIEDKSYPKLLKETDFAPFILYVKGSVEALNRPGLTVIGTRKMSEYGRRATSQLVGEIAKKLTIVSGLARGVDGWAHRVCLQNQGKTIAVLGHGLERIYPAEHRGLAEEIARSGGALVSEYPMDYPISKTNFPPRDRLLDGLSLGTLG